MSPLSPGKGSSSSFQRSGQAGGQSSKSTSETPPTPSLLTTPRSAPHIKSEGVSSAATLDTPLTHNIRTGGKIITSFSTGQRHTTSSAATAPHPLAASTVKQPSSRSCPEDHASAQSAQNPGQSASACAKGPVTRSSNVRSSSPVPSSEVPPQASNSPTDKSAGTSAEKLRGMSNEEARRLRQAQQKLQKEQWKRKYGQGGTVAAGTKRTLEMQGGGVSNSGNSGGSGTGVGGDGKPEVQTKVEMMDEVIGADALISDGKYVIVYCTTRTGL